MAIPYQTAKFKSANIYAIATLGPTAKFNSRQYFWRTSGVHSFYVPRLFYIYLYGDNVLALLWPACPALWSQFYRHYEYQLKIWAFFYLGQVVPSPESDFMWSYRPSKTTILDAFFQVFLQQIGKNSCLLAWLSNQKHGRGTKVAFTCLYFWHMNINSAILARLVAWVVPHTYSLKKYQRTSQALPFHL